MNRSDHSFEQGPNRNEDEEQFLQLSLSTIPISPVPIPPPPPEQETQQEPAVRVPSRKPRSRKYAQKLGHGKTETVPAPYPWATTQRATVHSLEHLLNSGINVITGQVLCKRCNKQYEIAYDLKAKFLEIATFVSNNKGAMHDRAPSVWLFPTLPNCKLCEQANCVRPVLDKKKSINWLFLFLGQILGVCKLSELKYFCKHTRNHRTGAKDRVLYLAYLALCKQLDPNGPFDP